MEDRTNGKATAPAASALPQKKPSERRRPSSSLIAQLDTGQPATLAEAAISGYVAQLRHMEEDVAESALEIMLSAIAKQYGARRDADAEVIAECVELVLSKFPFIGVSEIQEAYRQWVSGYLKLGGEAEMWGGEFNARQLGAVLSAYCEERKAVIAAFLNYTYEEKERRREAERAERLRREFDEKFAARIADARRAAAAGNLDWRDVPEYWYQSAMDRGMIDFSEGEAVGIYEEALELARIELQKDRENARDVFESTALLKALEGRNNRLEDRAKVIARKVSVYRKILIKNQ